jgi:hypothetical protein
MEYPKWSSRVFEKDPAEDQGLMVCGKDTLIRINPEVSVELLNVVLLIEQQE